MNPPFSVERMNRMANPDSRVMRRTGKLYGLTLISCFLTIIAASYVAAWNENTSAIHLWVDVFPQGLGMASVITTTLIVSHCVAPSVGVLKFRLQAMIASVGKEDLAVATGSKYPRYYFM